MKSNISMIITTFAIIIFSQGNPSYGFSCFSRRESARYTLPAAVNPPTYLFESPTEGVLFLTHPEMLTCMVGGQLGFITEFSPAVLTGELEVGPLLGNEHTKPYRIVTIHRKNPLSRASNVLCPMSAGILRVWGILSAGM
jgi:hypothetical protein